MFIELALVAGVDFLVSGDNDLIALRDSLRIKIVTASDLWNMRRRTAGSRTDQA